MSTSIDVDAVVKKGSAIDGHAATNTTSVYTAAGIFPMLPERLSTDLTSLAEGQEPLTLKQKMTPEQAKPAIERLRQNGGYWKFYCRNTGAGYFEVSRSEAAYASVKID